MTDHTSDTEWMRPPRIFPLVLPPLEQHKADLEMIITVCQLNAGVDAPDAYGRIAELAKSLLDRLPKS